MKAAVKAFLVQVLRSTTVIVSGALIVGGLVDTLRAQQPRTTPYYVQLAAQAVQKNQNTNGDDNGYVFYGNDSK